MTVVAKDPAQAADVTDVAAPRELSITRALGLELMFLALYLLPLALMVPLLASRAVRIDEHQADLIQLVFAWPITVAVGLRMVGGSAAELLRLRTRRAPLLLVSLILCSVGLMVLLMSVLDLIAAGTGAPPADDAAGRGGIAALLAAVVVAPLGEELLYRGVLLRGLLRRYSAAAAIAISTALFAVVHFNPGQILIALPLGAAYAWLTLRTGSVLPAVVSHAAVNATAYFLQPVAGAAAAAVTELDGARAATPSSFLLAGVILVTGAALAWHVLRPRGSAP